jgi:DnaJ-class molecular chaperone
VNSPKDYYVILGVDKSASEKEIKQAYRKLARRYHPDVNPGDQDAETRFKEINEANETLSDPEKRRRYDQMRQGGPFAYDSYPRGGPHGPEFSGAGAHRRSPFGGAGTFYFDPAEPGSGMGTDLFERLFGEMGAGRHQADWEQVVEVSLEEAFSGATRLVHTSNGRRLEVKIPPGVDTGSRVRIGGAGDGRGARAAGDLYLNISVRPHLGFERRGDDLFADVPIPLTTAVLGGEIEVKTLKSKAMLKVPPETQSDKRFRMGGMGMPRLGGRGRGDLYVRARVLLPTHLDDKERELFEELRKLRGG